MVSNELSKLGRRDKASKILPFVLEPSPLPSPKWSFYSSYEVTVRPCDNSSFCYSLGFYFNLSNFYPIYFNSRSPNGAVLLCATACVSCVYILLCQESSRGAVRKALFEKQWNCVAILVNSQSHKTFDCYRTEQGLFSFTRATISIVITYQKNFKMYQIRKNIGDLYSGKYNKSYRIFIRNCI